MSLEALRHVEQKPNQGRKVPAAQIAAMPPPGQTGRKRGTPARSCPLPGSGGRRLEEKEDFPDPIPCGRRCDAVGERPLHDTEP